MEAFRLMPHPGLPDGACDCHIHIYSPTQGVAADGSGRVMPEATLDAYRRVQARLGLRRAVIVQPNAYGTDNTTTLSAVAVLGTDACGVAIVTPATPEAELARLHRGGIRGARCHMLGVPLLSWTDVEAVAARVARLGWHVQVQLDGGSLPAHEALLRRLPCPIVIDHFGKFLDPVSPSHAAAQVLLRLLETGRHWLKLAAPYEVSRTGAGRTMPTYRRSPWQRSRRRRSAWSGRATGRTWAWTWRRTTGRCWTCCSHGQAMRR